MKAAYFTSIILLLCGSCYGFPKGYSRNVDVMSVGEDYLEVRFSSVEDARFYSVKVLPTDDEYLVNPHVEEIPANNAVDGYVTVNVSMALVPSQSYVVTVTTATIKDDILSRLVTGKASFTANDCSSDVFCPHIDTDEPQCFRLEWMCNGVIECGDQSDEADCAKATNSNPITNLSPSTNEGSTTTSPQETTTTQAESVLQCLDEQNAANQWSIKHPGQTEGAPRWPFCEPDGSYSPIQCTDDDASMTSTCMCTDEAGNALTDPVTFNLDSEELYFYEDDCRLLRGDSLEGGNIDTDHLDHW